MTLWHWIKHKLAMHELKKDPMRQSLLSAKHIGTINYDQYHIHDFDQCVETLASIRDKIIAVGYEWDFRGLYDARAEDVITHEEVMIVLVNTGANIWKGI